MASDESDIETGPTKKDTLPKSEGSESSDINQERKMSTKEMIKKALTDLYNRKGTSLYAIKNYMKEKFHTDTEKNAYLIKRYLKSAVEDGTIIQTKGSGAAGSFKLAKKKEEKKKKPKKTLKKPSDKTEKPDKKNIKKITETKEKREKIQKIPKKLFDDEKPKKVVKIKKDSKKGDEKKGSVTIIDNKDTSPTSKIKKSKGKKAKTAAMALAQTPAKKRASIIKRKSMGSIIKPPKMKPKK